MREPRGESTGIRSGAGQESLLLSRSTRTLALSFSLTQQSQKRLTTRRPSDEQSRGLCTTKSTLLPLQLSDDAAGLRPACPG